MDKACASTILPIGINYNLQIYILAFCLVSTCSYANLQLLFSQRNAQIFQDPLVENLLMCTLWLVSSIWKISKNCWVSKMWKFTQQAFWQIGKTADQAKMLKCKCPLAELWLHALSIRLICNFDIWMMKVVLCCLATFVHWPHLPTLASGLHQAGIEFGTRAELGFRPKVVQATGT